MLRIKISKAIPRSYTFVLARQRLAGSMRDRRSRRDQEPEDYSFMDQPSHRELLEIRKSFIEIFGLTQVQISVNSNDEACLVVVVPEDTTVEIPDEFQGLPVEKTSADK